MPTVPEEYSRIYDAVRLVANTFEDLGILVKNGIVDRALFLDSYGWQTMQTWKRLERVIAWTRAIVNQPTVWENFEYLTVLAEDFHRDHPSSYPEAMRRLEPHNPWPVPPMPAAA